ncbi:hypothetical protein DFH07DRAFT_774242 [Mycena maculata]|uniref:DUF6589 domain-containing protein n=1 Tax=Mycena maculata TaxID=230809 RepID=A0AAD7J1G2_9AGAR|nr:hypothetical protein DFH07DRAFT_774242 [Mycena maculata]
MLQGLHREWPPELWPMPVDEAQGMNIKDIKVTYRSEGPNIDWKFLKKFHPAIHVIRAINSHMETEFKTRVHGSKHTVPKKELDIQELQKWYSSSEVHKLTPGRVLKKKSAKKQSSDVLKDILAKGSAGIQTGESMANWIET